MGLNRTFWRDKSVFITGHTGFKGGWLALWLQKMGATVSGYSLAPPTKPNLYSVACVEKNIHSITADVCKLDLLQKTMKAEKPDFAFHFAAQPLVRVSYADPVQTFNTNIMGTVNFLEAIRFTPSVRAAVIVTSDKCYDNDNKVHKHKEKDVLGGSNPYASSKACAELITEAYRRTYFESNRTAIATVRAGNVIGGGDWGKDRLIPDLINAFCRKQVLELRYPNAIRPWQHVLEPLHGYLLLAEQLWRRGKTCAKGWNFGPTKGRPWRVSELVNEAARIWGQNAQWQIVGEKQLSEDSYLDIDSSMASKALGWKTKLDTKSAIKWSIDWYRAYLNDKKDMRKYSLKQIEKYELLT